MGAAAPAAFGANCVRVVMKEEPPTRIHLMENHDQAYYAWRDAGVRDRVLVHIDAHHDMWCIEDNRGITIANFICPALREGIVSEIYWIVPDRALKNAHARRELLAQIKSLAKDYKTDPRAIEITRDRITLPVLGKRLTIAALESLNFEGPPVLLDIDVDYLMIPQVSHDRADTHAAMPWRWPAELVSQIAAAQLSADLVTISYSIEGCYTPLAWKYLGTELESRIGGSADCSGYDRLREGATAAARGDLEDARASYLEAAVLMPQSAAPQYHLALLSAKLGRAEEARNYCRHALELDPTYATGFNNLGLHYFWQKRYSEAKAEFDRALMLDPGDAYAQVGMSRLAGRRKRWNEAIEWANKALDISDENLDAHRCLGEAYARSGRLDLAINHYERSLQLALHGQKPLSWHLLTCTQSGQLLDEDHCATYATLGRLRAKRGDVEQAIACYRIALNSNFGGVRERLRLARLYLRAGRREEAAEQVAYATRQLPRSAKTHARRARRAIVVRLGRLAARSRALA
ncbi:MAG: tetratricopeptide repeat protein [Candidatus Binataceae bacterium]